MREENPSESRAKASKFPDQNEAPKSQTTKTITNQSKPKSSWGSNIVKGFTADKKTKVQTITVQNKKLPLSNSDVANANEKNPSLPSHSRVKRSLITDLSCSVNASQFHPQVYPTHRRQSSGSRDLFIELDHVRSLLQESKEREFKLQAELTEWKTNAKVLDLETQLETRNIEVDDLSQRVGLLESEKTSLCDQVATLSSILERNEDNLEISKEPLSISNLEMEVVELRRLNKELQLQKRNLASKLSSSESQLAYLSKANESDVAKIKAEASMLRHTNENLSKQVEGLQMSRLNEVEELAYLRWVNSCLRDELQNSFSTIKFDKTLSPVQSKGEYVSSKSSLERSNVKRLNLIKKIKKWPEEFSSIEYAANLVDKDWVTSPGRRHSISGSKCYIEELIPNKRRQSDGFICIKEMEKEAEPLSSQKYGTVQRMQFFGNCQEPNKPAASLDVIKRALRIPNPPPRPSCSIPNGLKEESSNQIPPPPPPLPTKFSVKSSTGVVQRAPQVVEFYHSLMKRDSKKDSTNGGICDVPDVANVRSSMIGEIENRSAHLLAIKADVETQGEFVNSLIREVNSAVYQNIEDVVAFVKWLDDELCYLVDERAVLKHFDWPEKKADTLREAAFGYRDLKKLESEVLYYEDDSRMPCDVALKKMVALSEKMERSVYNLHRTRESLMRNCKEYQIPREWMLDNGITSKIKLGSVKLAKKYMKRVAMELQLKATLEKDTSMDYMLLQGMRFAFRIHQFAGGFDSETMHAFEELRNLANLLNNK
ncbi:protein CHUP1, chloroplastic-like [Durio zibethinus]|uniref:Protein CHUP1, chloroplastic-like n=1 Tax=Durio zibethinus TaxID=66656 RepID=A0A6P5WZC4_DURZI|nr:protein CHUP1, chloroplastic-like [Durio zibethinus]